MNLKGPMPFPCTQTLPRANCFWPRKGSGQAIFVGLAPDHYIAASELYGVVEETRHYIKLNGEDKGQIVVLDQEGAGGIEGVRSFYYDYQPITLTREDVLTSQITSRDIDRQGYNPLFSQGDLRIPTVR